MEFETLTYPQFDHVIRRVAAAFGIEQLKAGWEDAEQIGYFGWNGGILFGLELTHEGELSHLWVGDSERKFSSDIYFDTTEYSEEKEWWCSPHPKYDWLMACACYRLGLEGENIQSQLPTLSAHEKLELRLSLPREFSPKSGWMRNSSSGRFLNYVSCGLHRC